MRKLNVTELESRIAPTLMNLGTWLTTHPELNQKSLTDLKSLTGGRVSPVKGANISPSQVWGDSNSFDALYNKYFGK